MAGTVLLPNDFPVNALTHLYMNNLNFYAYCSWENQKSRKIMFFILDPKPQKVLIKRRNDKISGFVACQIMGDLSRYISDKHNSMKIYKY